MKTLHLLLLFCLASCGEPTGHKNQTYVISRSEQDEPLTTEEAHSTEVIIE